VRKRIPTPNRRCPFPECPSHDVVRSKGVVRHGFMRSRTGARLRLMCRTCGRTFCGRRGTAYYRLQHPRSTFDQFADLLTEGLSAASLSRALRVCPATISRWLARASKHAGAFAEQHDEIDAPFELQFDELSARPASQPKSPWIFTGIEVASRFWVASSVGRRNRRTTREFVLRARQSCGVLHKPILITSDPFPFYNREILRTFGGACVYVQVKNRYRQNKMMRSTPKLVFGHQWMLDAMQARSEDSKKLNTSYIERLNLSLRRRCSYLHRRTSGRVRNPTRLASMVELIRCHYNYIKPHQRLRFGAVTRTPAMQAGIFDRAQSWRRVFAWPRKPPTPAQTLDAEPRQSHSSRSIVTPRSGINLELLAAVNSEPRNARRLSAWMAPTRTLVPP
jgi:transposase-like protein